MKPVVSLTEGDEEVFKDPNLFHLVRLQVYTPLFNSCEYWKLISKSKVCKKRLYLTVTKVLVGLTRILPCAYGVTGFGLATIIGFGTNKIISPPALQPAPALFQHQLPYHLLDKRVPFAKTYLSLKT